MRSSSSIHYFTIHKFAFACNTFCNCSVVCEKKFEHLTLRMIYFNRGIHDKQLLHTDTRRRIEACVDGQIEIAPHVDENFKRWKPLPDPHVDRKFREYVCAKVASGATNWKLFEDLLAEIYEDMHNMELIYAECEQLCTKYEKEIQTFGQGPRPSFTQLSAGPRPSFTQLSDKVSLTTRRISKNEKHKVLTLLKPIILRKG